MLTPKDLENPQRKSGYDHVNYQTSAASKPGSKPYMAQSYAGGHPNHPGKGMAWIGPRRATALEAAQDYCDYVNNGDVVTPATLKSAGHKNRSRTPLPTDPEVEAALGVLRDAKGQAEGKKGYVYCILEDAPGGAMRYVKIGYSTNPWARVAELQTGNPRKLNLHALKEGTLEDEAAIHRRHIHKNVLQEWFRPDKALLLEFDLDSNGKAWGSA